MTVVESVNGKTGEVVLTASNVEAVPTSEVGKPNGVAELNSEGKLVEGELPSSVVSGSADGFAPSVIWLDTTPEYYGAMGDGVTDDTAAFQLCSEAIVASGGGVMRLSAKVYVVDGYEWESGVWHEGRSANNNIGTILKAVAGSTNPGQILLKPGVVEGGWKNICFKGAANAEQDGFYMHAQEVSGSGGVHNSIFENLHVGTGNYSFFRNAMWFRGGAVNTGGSHQFNTFCNIVISRYNSPSSRAVKLSGQCSKFTWINSSFNGIGAPGTNLELTREFAKSTTLSAGAAVGATSIAVASGAGLEVGRIITLDEGAQNELCKITSIEGTTIYFAEGLQFAHVEGVNVYALAGTAASPSTSSPDEFLWLGGAIQVATLEVLVDGAQDGVINFMGTDFEGQSSVLRVRNSNEVNLQSCHYSEASEGEGYGKGILTPGSNQVTSTNKEWKVGERIAGPGIPQNTTVTKVEGTTLTISAKVGNTGSAAGVAMSLIRGSNGGGYVACYEDASTGKVSGQLSHIADQYVVSRGNSSVRVEPLGLIGTASITTSGVTLTCLSNGEITVYHAKEVVVTSATASISTIVGSHGVGETVTIRAAVAGVKLATGGNLYLGGKASIELAEGECATLQRTDYGPYTWILAISKGEPGTAGAGSAKDDLVTAGLGFLTVGFPLALVTSNETTTAGTIYGTPVGLFAGEEVTNLLVVVNTAGTGAVPTLIRLGLANPAGEIVAVTANLHESPVFTAISEPVAICPLESKYKVPTSGCYCIVVIQVGTWGTTQITLGRSTVGSVKAGTKYGSAKYGATNIFGTSKTDLPIVGKTLEAATASTSGSAYWVGAS